MEGNCRGRGRRPAGTLQRPPVARACNEEDPMACAKLPTCIFFNDQIENMPAVAELLKSQYCRGVFAECARFRVAARLGGGNVPCDLYPNNAARAEKILDLQSSIVG